MGDEVEPDETSFKPTHWKCAISTCSWQAVVLGNQDELERLGQEKLIRLSCRTVDGIRLQLSETIPLLTLVSLIQ